jgi:hypothetical protein
MGAHMKAGRKFTYDSSKFDALVASVSKAKGSFGQVADLNDITRDCIYHWLNTGDSDRDNGIRSDLAQLSGRLRKEQANVVLELCETALKDEKKSKFIMWCLALICREDFGVEGVEIKKLRDMFNIILPLLGKGMTNEIQKRNAKEEDAGKEANEEVCQSE